MNGAAESAEGTKEAANSHGTNSRGVPEDKPTFAQSYQHEHSASQPSDFPNPDTALPSVKTEPTSATLDRIPASEGFDIKSFDGAGDIPTSKKVANLKNNGLNSRASSSDRSSPANSVKPTANKKTGSAATKKGTAKKPTNKKRKGNDMDADSVDRDRSNTPASVTSKGPGKKQSPVSVAGSPAPEAKNKKKKQKPGKKRVEEDGDESYEDESEIFCICRRPDNHTWMIGCDGGCEDWFHGKCVNIDPRDADLIEKYICESPRRSPTRTSHSNENVFQARTAASVARGSQLGNVNAVFLNVASQPVPPAKIPASTAQTSTGESSCVDTSSNSSHSPSAMSPKAWAVWAEFSLWAN